MKCIRSFVLPFIYSGLVYHAEALSEDCDRSLGYRTAPAAPADEGNAVRTNRAGAGFRRFSAEKKH